MPRYLDPKNDVTFKRVFAAHKHLCVSLLNALLPVEETGMRRVEDIEYLPTELLPDSKGGCYSVVDLRCTDALGRQFLVEMQLHWPRVFRERVLRNSCRAYSSQMSRGGEYEDLKPIYALSFLYEKGGAFEDNLQEFYYRFTLREDELAEERVEGLELIFVDLWKFAQARGAGAEGWRKLWLCFLAEVNEQSREMPEELTKHKEIAEALQYLEEWTYSPAALETYYKCWDAVSRVRSIERENEEEGEARGLERGRAEVKQEIALKMKAAGMSVPDIANITGLDAAEIEAL
jgi:predicted transposase/invertase (TIGR01784 family)